MGLTWSIDKPACSMARVRPANGIGGCCLAPATNVVGNAGPVATSQPQRQRRHQRRFGCFAFVFAFACDFLAGDLRLEYGCPSSIAL